MKANKQISIDFELIPELKELGLNVSEFCNEKLWTYVTECKKKAGKIKEETRDIEKEIKELEILKEENIKKESLKKLRDAAGITPKLQTFLENMNTNIMCAKDNKIAYQRITGNTIGWEELKELKEKWA